LRIQPGERTARGVRKLGRYRMHLSRRRCSSRFLEFAVAKLWRFFTPLYADAGPYLA
jgi:hypothetical protein